MYTLGGSGKQPTLILASGSPRRRQLLALLGLPFVVHPADVEELNHRGEGSAEMVLRLSQDKARAVSARVRAGLMVAADTTVALEGKVLGKPADAVEAVQMLRALRARIHTVFSGVTLLDAQTGWMHSELAESTVWMRDYSDAEIATYVATGDPLDKAGAYAIQHAGFDPVWRIDGCYANVMGLPLCHLYRLLREIGRAPPQSPVAACERAHLRKCDVAAKILTGGQHEMADTKAH